jgi:DNA-binding IclR family transcriptional regulator
MLEILSDHTEGLSIKELSDEMDIHKSTVHRIAGTLVHLGYLSQNPDNQKYLINLSILNLGLKRLQDLDIVNVAKPHLKELLSKTDETITLGTIEGNQVVYIDKLKPKRSQFTINSYIGKSMPLYCTAVGKAMLAYMPRENFEKLWSTYEFHKLTDNTITDKEDMLKDIEKIKEKGYAVDDEENQMGVTCIAAPVFNHRGEVKYSLSISTPKMRLSFDMFSDFANLITKSAEELSKELGYKKH